MLKQSVTAGLTKAFNRYLQLDPDSSTRLAALNGKVIALEFQPPGVTLYFQCEADRIHVLNDWEGHVDTHLIGGPISMAQLGFSPLKQFMNRHVEIHGDHETGQDFQRLLDEIDIPWQRHVASLVGDELAHHLSKGAESMKRWSQDSAKSMQENVTEYLQEELRLLPPREALNDFFHDIDTLRMAADRLSARIELLRKNESL